MTHKETILAVQKMQDYIEAHLNEAITLSDLAKAANYSQSHSSRIFKELTGKLPFEYIRALRLTTAARALRDNDVKVLILPLILYLIRTRALQELLVKSSEFRRININNSLSH